MPADRTKSLKRSDSGNQLVWTTQFEPPAPMDVNFTSCDTPIDFLDSLPPLVDAPPSEFILFPPPGGPPAPRRQPHSKKKPENHIPRPPNAFILFRSSFIKGQHVSTEVETNHSTLSKIIGLTWQRLPEEERQIWHAKAKEALDEHKRKFPKYAFRPVQTKAKGAPAEKRKVREVEPKDTKRCAKIAQLLVEGKKGQELENAIQEFDKTHIPEIITRFETPITAKAYRRSSSAPIPDTEKARSGQTFFVKEAPQQPRKARAASTRCSTPAIIAPHPTMEANIPLKQESSFNFADFSFDNVGSPIHGLECDPFFVHQTEYQPTSQYGSDLTIDTSFMGAWSPASSPLSPSTPSDMLSPSPSPSYSSFDSFDSDMNKSFDDFSAYSLEGFDPACHIPQNMATVDSCGMVGSTNGLYSSFENHHQPQIAVPLTHLDLDFSTFMGGIPQYAM